MDLHVSLDAAGDRTARIYLALRSAIVEGRLDGGDRVPPSRELAAQLDVARGTVTAAYDRLIAEGFLQTRAGSGTFVCGEFAATARAPRAPEGEVVPVALWAGLLTGSGDQVDDQVDGQVGGAASGLGRLLATGRGLGSMTVEFDFSVGIPDATLFPLALWRRLVSGQLRQRWLADPTYNRWGHERLQAEIARHVGLARSVVASGDDVVVTAGAQQALDLVARVLVEPGAVVAMEDPGYTAARDLFVSHRARVHGVPVDGEGLVVDALPDSARVVYVTPSHQFPTGVAMSLARRTALLQWAARRGAVIVEDDYDSEYRFADRPLEPLQSLDREGRVVYVGSFSKSLLPALRMGFLIAPASLQPALREAKRITVWDGDAMTQGALAEFLAEGHHAAHVRRASKVYRLRRDVLLSSLDSLADHLEVIPSAAGLHVCALLRDQRRHDVDIVDAARHVGVYVEPISTRHHDQPARQGLALGIGGIESAAVPEAVRRIGHALAS